MSDRLFLLDTNIVLALVRGGPLGAYLDETFGLRAAKAAGATLLTTDQDFDHLTPELLKVERGDPDAGKGGNA